jgi:hypothetical protein
MNFDIENWLWKSNFGTFWQLTIKWRIFSRPGILGSGINTIFFSYWAWSTPWGHVLSLKTLSQFSWDSQQGRLGWANKEKIISDFMYIFGILNLFYRLFDTFIIFSIKPKNGDILFGYYMWILHDYFVHKSFNGTIIVQEITCMKNMVIPVVEFSREGYKIRQIFGIKSTVVKWNHWIFENWSSGKLWKIGNHFRK